MSLACIRWGPPDAAQYYLRRNLSSPLFVCPGAPLQVALGSFFTAVLSAEGRVYTFSWGETERLGHATEVSDSEPRLLAGGGMEALPVVQIAGGHCYLLMLTYSPGQPRCSGPL